MKLSRYVVQLMTVYRTWRDKPPTYSAMLWVDAKRLAIVTIGCVAIALGCRLMDATIVGLIPLGLWIGFFLSESGRLRSTVNAWPAIDRVIDWDRVEQAISAGEIE